MPKPQKRGKGHIGQKPTPTFSAPQPASHSFNTPSPPSPFCLAPDALKPFLEDLATDHIYITSLDHQPRDFKRRLYIVPLLLNIFLSVVLLWRLRYALPTYVSLFLTMFGFETEHAVIIHYSDTASLFGILGDRMLMMMGDFVLFRFIGGWPWAFFFGWLGGNNGLGSPVAWRRAVGWRDEEIVVRRSRRWDRAIFEQAAGEAVREAGKTGSVEEWLEKGKSDLLFQERIEPAVASRWIREKTGYLMMDKSWDLSFEGMTAAHHLLGNGEITVEEFKTRVLIYSEKYGGWLSWDVWKEHDEENGRAEGRGKLRAIKDKLTMMGKENLFFRWVEVLQSETSSQPEPFTQQRRDKALMKVREEFEEQDVDFDEFWDSVGGVDSMPGLEIDV